MGGGRPQGLPSWDVIQGKTEKIDALFLQAGLKNTSVCPLGLGVSQLKNALLVASFNHNLHFSRVLSP